MEQRAQGAARRFGGGVAVFCVVFVVELEVSLEEMSVWVELEVVDVMLVSEIVGKYEYRYA